MQLTMRSLTGLMPYRLAWTCLLLSAMAWSALAAPEDACFGGGVVLQTEPTQQTFWGAAASFGKLPAESMNQTVPLLLAVPAEACSPWTGDLTGKLPVAPAHILRCLSSRWDLHSALFTSCLPSCP